MGFVTLTKMRMHSRRRFVLCLLVAGMIILFAAAFFLYEPVAHEMRYAALLRAIRSRDAIREAEAAWSRGDARFIGIYGIGLSCPGVLEESGLREKYGVNSIQGTSDNLIGDTQLAFQNAAYEFATRYNREILARIQNTPKLKASSSKEH